MPVSIEAYLQFNGAIVGCIFRNLSPSQIRCHFGDLKKVSADIEDEEWELENFLMELPEKWALSFCVWIDDAPVAYAIMSARNDAVAHLHQFMVSRRYRGSGLGNSMIREMVVRCLRANKESLTLKVRNSNTGAIKFYEKNGFSIYLSDSPYLTMIRPV